MERIGGELGMLALSGVLVWSSGHADGFRNPFQGGAAIAQGNAFAAQADDASAVFYNPAGLTQLHGVQTLGGVEWVSPNTRFQSSTGQKTANDVGNPFGLPPPAQFFIAATPRDLGVPWLGKLSVGFGVQSLFGFGNHYPGNSPLRTSVTSLRLPLLDLKPTVAYRFADWLALGIGADIFTFWDGVLGQAKQKFVSPGLSGIPAGAHVELTGSGTTAGLNVSALLTLLRMEGGAPRLNVGWVWRSAADLPLDGALRVNGTRVARSHTSLRLPESYTIGLAAWPLRDAKREWKVETDLDLVRWSSLRNLDFRFSNGAILHNPQDWKDAVTVGVGTEYRWLGPDSLRDWDVALRLGYLWSMTPIPDQNFNPGYPDSNVHMFAFGVGFTCRPGGLFLGFKSCGQPGEGAVGQSIGLDFAYQLFLQETRTVSENPNPAVNGKYQTATNALVMSFRAGF